MMRWLAVALLAASSAIAAPQITKETIVSGGGTRVYYLFVPDRPAGAPPAPLIVTLHGSGHNGRILIEHWQKLAAKEGIVLAGPDSINSQQWSSPADGPDFLLDVIEEVKKKTTIDPRRVYLFGHSAGAIFALQMSLLRSEYFAATAAHAGMLYAQSYPLMSWATRKIPIWIVVGTRDPFFPLAGVRATRDELQKNGFPVELWEIAYHNHDYYSRSREINDRAWQFLSKVSLEHEPHQ